MAAPRSSAEHMTPSDWAMMGEYVKSLPFGKRGSQSVATKFDIPPQLVTEYCRQHRIPQSKQQLVEYFLTTPDSLGLTRHQIAAKLGCNPSVVCRILSSMYYPPHDLASGYVDYMQILHTYESKKKVLAQCIYCGTQKDLILSTIKYRPNGVWCKCEQAEAYRKAKFAKARINARDVYGFNERSAILRAKMAYEYWMKHDESLLSICKRFETSVPTVHKYRNVHKLPHKWAGCEQDT